MGDRTTKGLIPKFVLNDLIKDTKFELFSGNLQNQIR